MASNRSKPGIRLIPRLLPLALFAIIVVSLMVMVSTDRPVWARPMQQPPLYPSITGTVLLEGRPLPPDASWSVPLTVDLLCPALYTYGVTTDQYGEFSLTHVISGTSTCDIRVKNAHTLRNIKTGVVLNPGYNVHFLEVLLEGDADDDNIVTLVDFSILATTYDKGSGDPEFDGRADFNENDWIEIADFSLLATNYDVSGDIPAIMADIGSDTDVRLTMRLTPSQMTVPEGRTFTVDIRLVSKGQPFQGVAAFLTFNPAELVVVDESGAPAAKIMSTGVLPAGVANQVDNTAGTIAYSAGILGANPPAEEFTIATIRFKAKKSNLDGSPIRFIVEDYPPKTKIAAAGQYLPLDLANTQIRIARGLGKLPPIMKR